MTCRAVPSRAAAAVFLALVGVGEGPTSAQPASICVGNNYCRGDDIEGDVAFAIAISFPAEYAIPRYDESFLSSTRSAPIMMLVMTIRLTL